jgi:hypothetical protein
MILKLATIRKNEKKNSILFYVRIVDIENIVVGFIIVLIAIVAAALVVLATVVVGFIVLAVIASTTVHLIFVFTILLLMF